MSSTRDMLEKYHQIKAKVQDIVNTSWNLGRCERAEQMRNPIEGEECKVLRDKLNSLMRNVASEEPDEYDALDELSRTAKAGGETAVTDHQLSQHQFTHSDFFPSSHSAAVIHKNLESDQKAYVESKIFKQT